MKEEPKVGDRVMLTAPYIISTQPNAYDWWGELPTGSLGTVADNPANEDNDDLDGTVDSEGDLYVFWDSAPFDSDLGRRPGQYIALTSVEPAPVLPDEFTASSIEEFLND